MGTIMSVK
jgi:hypothetical protein